MALVTQAYRQALDKAWEEREGRRGGGGEERREGEGGGDDALSRKRRMMDLAQIFARGQDASHDGLSHGFLNGKCPNPPYHTYIHTHTHTHTPPLPSPSLPFPLCGILSNIPCMIICTDTDTYVSRIIILAPFLLQGRVIRT